MPNGSRQYAGDHSKRIAVFGAFPMEIITANRGNYHVSPIRPLCSLAFPLRSRKPQLPIIQQCSAARFGRAVLAARSGSRRFGNYRATEIDHPLSGESKAIVSRIRIARYTHTRQVAPGVQINSLLSPCKVQSL